MRISRYDYFMTARTFMTVQPSDNCSLRRYDVVNSLCFDVMAVLRYGSLTLWQFDVMIVQRNDSSTLWHLSIPQFDITHFDVITIRRYAVTCKDASTSFIDVYCHLLT